MKRILIVVALVSGLVFPSAASASIKNGASCSRLGQTQVVGANKFVCTKAPRGLSNPFGKKFVWKKRGFAKLEEATTTAARISILNSSGLGYWKQIRQSENPNFDGEAYISSWPCILYIANNEQAQVDIWNMKVNYQMYGGSWVATDVHFFVVNEPSYDPQQCVRYFALKYGGQVRTQ